MSSSMETCGCVRANSQLQNAIWEGTNFSPKEEGKSLPAMWCNNNEQRSDISLLSCQLETPIVSTFFLRLGEKILDFYPYLEL